MDLNAKKFENKKKYLSAEVTTEFGKAWIVTFSYLRCLDGPLNSVICILDDIFENVAWAIYLVLMKYLITS